ncbi:MAG: hypothetical protein H8E47_07440 [Anaerolineales bacterium]|nr:hypothetical protein [Anaerolineales bacterium]
MSSVICIGNDLITDATLRHAIYQEERKLFDAQSKSEGYLRRFTYRFSVTRYANTDDETTQILAITGRATCNCSFGFNIYVDQVEEEEA